MTDDGFAPKDQSTAQPEEDHRSGYVHVGPLQGWQCPQCGGIWGPFVQGCPVCNSQLNVPYVAPDPSIVQPGQFGWETACGSLKQEIFIFAGSPETARVLPSH